MGVGEQRRLRRRAALPHPGPRPRRALLPPLLRLAAGPRLWRARVDHDRADGRRELDQPAILRLDRGKPRLGQRQQDATQRGRPTRRARGPGRRPARGSAVAVRA